MNHKVVKIPYLTVRLSVKTMRYLNGPINLQRLRPVLYYSVFGQPVNTNRPLPVTWLHLPRRQVGRLPVVVPYFYCHVRLVYFQTYDFREEDVLLFTPNFLYKYRITNIVNCIDYQGIYSWNPISYNFLKRLMFVHIQWVVLSIQKLPYLLGITNFTYIWT